MVLPEEISDQNLLAESPLVSVLMLTYNHGDTLAQAIDGVVSQLCDFKFELLIGEDASTDQTLRVALSYQKKYPTIIRVVHFDKNVGMNNNFSMLVKLSRGKYLAFCEGDDYWCDSTKVARQVACFAADVHIGAVHSDWVCSREKAGLWHVDWSGRAHRNVPAGMLSGDLFKCFYSPRILRTCTLMIVKSLAEEIEGSILRSKHYRFVDTVYASFLTSKSLVGYMPEVTAVYRISKNSALRSGKKAKVRFLLSALEFDGDAREFFKGRHDYPMEYRWEICMGIIFHALMVGDLKAVLRALNSIRTSYSVKSFFAAGFCSLNNHYPAFFRWRHSLNNPCDTDDNRRAP